MRDESLGKGHENILKGMQSLCSTRKPIRSAFSCASMVSGYVTRVMRIVVAMQKESIPPQVYSGVEMYRFWVQSMYRYGIVAGLFQRQGKSPSPAATIFKKSRITNIEAGVQWFWIARTKRRHHWQTFARCRHRSRLRDYRSSSCLLDAALFRKASLFALISSEEDLLWEAKILAGSHQSASFS